VTHTTPGNARRSQVNGSVMTSINNITKAIASLVLSGTGLGLVLFMGSAIIRDLIRDIKGGQWKL